MKRNTTQRERVIGNDSGSASKAQLLIDLKRSILDVRQELLTLDPESGDYMPYMISQAAREGIVLDQAERKAIRQIMAGRVFSGDVERVEFIKRAVKAQQAAA